MAIELPTGTGKTLPGLLIAEWSRREHGEPVAFACPTVQLARQVVAAAEREGVPVVELTGRSQEWDNADRLAYEAATAVAVVTYSTIFNSHPKLAQARTIVFDDAHAGEQYVAEAYAIQISRKSEPLNFDTVLDAVENGFDPVYVRLLRGQLAGATHSRDVRALVPSFYEGMSARLDDALAKLGGDVHFSYLMVREVLDACIVYASVDQIYIRPLVPPTDSNALFAHAKQRVYLSATLGRTGEIERAFGRPSIYSLALPEENREPRSGRRFFVFPSLVDTNVSNALAKELVAEMGKALVLAPSRMIAEELGFELAQESWLKLTIADVGDGMQKFAEAKQATCALASRYDGLDLPGDACRAVVMANMPDQMSLHERFLAERVRAQTAVAERVRSRVVQGIGRCTRGPGDTAVVIVLGTDLTKFFMARSTLSALEPEIQAEVEFGLANSEGAEPGDVVANVRHFRDQDGTWLAEGEPEIARLRADAQRTEPEWVRAHSASVAHEVGAYVHAANGDWGQAAQSAYLAATELGKGGEETRGYRSLWLLLAAAWTRASNPKGADAVKVARATELYRKATSAAIGPWISQMRIADDYVEESLGSAADSSACSRVAALAEAKKSASSKLDQITAAIAALEGTLPGPFEEALSILGGALGAEASKPEGAGRCDSAWCWEDYLWLALEAKSDHEPDGQVSHRDIRQANDQLRLLTSERGGPLPSGSVTVVVSPRANVCHDGVKSAETHVHLVHPDTLLQIGRDTLAAWTGIVALADSLPRDLREAAVRDHLSAHGLLPRQVVERLTTNNVAGA